MNLGGRAVPWVDVPEGYDAPKGEKIRLIYEERGRMSEKREV